MFIFAAEIKSNKNMEELKVLANSYAEENVINVLKEAFAKVYADGYRDGYMDCQNEIPVDLRNTTTEYVDLGLPSGTLWSADYLKGNDKRKYLPFSQTESLCIPTEEQWNELVTTCKWEFDIDKAYDLCEARCVGPNGNSLRFESTGKQNINSHSETWEVFFWIKDTKEGFEKNAVHIYNGGKELRSKSARTEIDTFFSGYKLPIRLVRKK